MESKRTICCTIIISHWCFHAKVREKWNSDTSLYCNIDDEIVVLQHQWWNCCHKYLNEEHVAIWKRCCCECSSSRDFILHLLYKTWVVGDICTKGNSHSEDVLTTYRGWWNRLYQKVSAKETVVLPSTVSLSLLLCIAIRVIIIHITIAERNFAHVDLLDVS